MTGTDTHPLTGTIDPAKLPIGMRNNNPGNLRACIGTDYPTRLREGFAVYNSLHDGARGLIKLLDYYYKRLGLHTVEQIVTRYAPPSENDCIAYINFVSMRLRISPLAAKYADTHLDMPWRMIDMARAIIEIEQGRPITGWPTQDEWLSPQQLIDAYADALKEQRL